MECLRLAERQRVEAARQKWCRGEHQGSDRRERSHLGPVRAAERAHRPESEVAQLPVVADIGEDADERACQRGERDAGQQHRRDRGPPAAGRDSIKGRGRSESAEERGGRQQRK